MKSEHIQISRRLVRTVFVALAVTLPTILISWFVVCERTNVYAQNYINKEVVKTYPELHAPCSTRVEALHATSVIQSADIKKVKESVDFLVMLEQQRMTWEDKQRIVESLVKNDSMSYEAAYTLINRRKK